MSRFVRAVVVAEGGLHAAEPNDSFKDRLEMADHTNAFAVGLSESTRFGKGSAAGEGDKRMRKVGRR